MPERMTTTVSRRQHLVAAPAAGAIPPTPLANPTVPLDGLVSGSPLATQPPNALCIKGALPSAIHNTQYSLFAPFNTEVTD